MHHIYNPPCFDYLWHLVSDDPEKNSITHEMYEPLHQLDIETCTPDHVGSTRPYLLIGKDKEIISISDERIVKHKLGTDPSCWKFAQVGPIEPPKGSAPIHVLTDRQLFGVGILDIASNMYDMCKTTLDRDHDKYMELLPNMNKGDIVHIPVYDSYSVDHMNIHRCLLIFDGERLRSPKCEDDYGLSPPTSLTFPEFPLEHFAVLGRGGELQGGYRWVSAEVMDMYIDTPVFFKESNDGYTTVCKKITIKGKDYWFTRNTQIMLNDGGMLVCICKWEDGLTSKVMPPDTMVLNFCNRELMSD